MQFNYNKNFYICVQDIEGMGWPETGLRSLHRGGKNNVTRF